MAARRKRKRPARDHGDHHRDQKRQKGMASSSHGVDPVVRHALLAKYYPRVLTLREYLVSQLPSSSKIRKKKILHVGRNAEDKETDQKLSQFLDQTLVGVSRFKEAPSEERRKQWSAFSQRPDESVSLVNLSGAGAFSQTEVVDFAIWLIFTKTTATYGKVPHLLCQGFKKDAPRRLINQGESAASAIPGLVSIYPNSHVTAMKARPWPQILNLMGKEGEGSMIDLILDCGVFLAVERGRGTYHQLSGIPLGDLPLLEANPPKVPKTPKIPTSTRHTPASINFVRHRMMYARPALNAKLEVKFGLRHIQNVDPLQTMQPFKDYTLREDEINTVYHAQAPKIPRRLRGKAARLVRKLQMQHSRCPYKALLEYYCPVFESSPRLPIPGPTPEPSLELKTQMSVATEETTRASFPPMSLVAVPPKPSMMNHATPTAMVSAFCRAVLSHLIPSDFWGTGDDRVHNERLFYKNIDRFIELRRFETLSLHEVTQGLKVRFSHVRLLPKEAGVRPIMNLRRRALKTSSKTVLGMSINSVLAPAYNVLTYEKNSNPALLGSTLFSVGDLYTRLKAFKSTLPPQTPLYFAKLDVTAAFDTIPQRAILDLLSMLPSEASYRISKHCELKPGESHLTDHTAKPTKKWVSLAYAPDDFDTFAEHLAHEDGLAQGKKNAVFVESVVGYFRDKEEILELLKEHVLRNMVKIGKKFYRQKEGIPQGSVVSSLLCNYFYADLEATHLGFLNSGSGGSGSHSLLLRLIDDFLLITSNRAHAKRFLEVMHAGVPDYGVKVHPDKTLVNFEVCIAGKKVPRLVGGSGDGDGGQGFPYCGNLVDMQTLNVRRDRERRGATAVVDSLTVEFSRMPGKAFQKKVLTALFPPPPKHPSPPPFEISSRTNAIPIPKQKSSTDESTHLAQDTFKIQCHAMYLDTSFNALPTVQSNLSLAFTETATKMWTYARSLPSHKRPGPPLVIQTIQRLVAMASVLVQGKGPGRKRGDEGYRCAVSPAQLEMLAVCAFREVLGKRQSRYGEVIGWLDGRIGLGQAGERGRTRARVVHAVAVGR
ncbi:telomerase reverse transcriptase [Drepanopeziza brunnea f. sp. 'multigermtubi' MB_m1]|uniref:Telomerase reverse transcriptase n=1 Tax=Marssonina brunnea f. sp. multigermtubi (strain MB_m1) TaxID=1072389 RepID=K1WI00_MARBU|nr:telomerase reverse transcriptase [Drepanopeziza brunnea f. sp. 'multigermtubi' MB_m1]EKD17210.1 telomerase reverse transcriptase [Drepanopeziza brunnea f. sp. 'multigermtubi' MB_m1]